MGISLGMLEELAEKEDLTIVGLIRGERHTPAPSDFELLHAGDVLLLQGPAVRSRTCSAHLACSHWPRRGLRLGHPRRRTLALGLFGAAIVLITLRVLPPEIAFTLAAVAMVLTGLLTLRESYQAIDWPVIVLLAAMIPGWSPISCCASRMCSRPGPRWPFC